MDLALIGFEEDQSTEVSVETSFSTRNLGAVSEVTTSTNYQLSQRLDYVIASILNRNLGTKSQLFVSDIPGEIDLYASRPSFPPFNATNGSCFFTSFFNVLITSVGI